MNFQLLLFGQEKALHESQIVALLTNRVKDDAQDVSKANFKRVKIYDEYNIYVGDILEKVVEFGNDEFGDGDFRGADGSARGGGGGDVASGNEKRGNKK